MVELPGWPVYDNVDVVKGADSGPPRLAFSEGQLLLGLEAI